jgi:hypothetical protein
VYRKALLLILVVLAAACSERGTADTGNARTEAERDSLIGESALPGAQGVRAARRAADAGEQRAATLDSIAQ